MTSPALLRSLLLWSLAALCLVACHKQTEVVDAGARADYRGPEHCEVLGSCQQACASGAGPACAGMATRAFAGLGVPRDLGTGWAFEMKACELQHAPSCARLAVAVRTGVVDGGEAEPWTERARSLLPTQCEQGSAEACETGARLALSGTLELDAGAWLSKTQALEEAGCARGDARACHRLGLALWSGSWSTTDVDAGVQALSRGCTLGLAGACAALGLKFRSGDGLERDPARSMALLHQAALLSADAGH